MHPRLSAPERTSARAVRAQVAADFSWSRSYGTFANLHGDDLWPSGPMYGGTITFGDQKCWPTPVSETF